jgi:hypothetical protein
MADAGRLLKESQRMTWVLEEPLYILLLGLLVLGFLGFALMQTGARGLLHAMAGVAAVTGGLLLLEHMVETPREEIENALKNIARDVESNDLDAILSHVYSGAPNIYSRAKNEFPRYEFESVDIKNNVKVSFEEGSTPRRARVTFNVVVDVKHKNWGSQHHVPRFVKVTLVREEGAWRVAQYAHFKPQQGLMKPSG